MTLGTGIPKEGDLTGVSASSKVHNVSKSSYDGAFNEMRSNGQIRNLYENVHRWINEQGVGTLLSKTEEAEALFRRIGITFAVYGANSDPERLIPFDLVPRIFDASEWERLSQGVAQRALALNAFLKDVYSNGEILKAGIVPESAVSHSAGYLDLMKDFNPPGDVYTHIVGTDLVRTSRDTFLVLEDNCRTPSGVSYMLENREIMVRMFPELVAGDAIQPVNSYPQLLRRALEWVKPAKCGGRPSIVLLSPGPYNSAYYEHSFLADEMGIDVVEGADLFVDGDLVWMRTTEGPRRVDVIYRRIDDDFLDPAQFNPESVLGVRNLMDAYKAGGVTIANAPGTGIADNKAIYPYVPDMIRFYLGEEPLLDNVETWRCSEPSQCQHVIENLSDLVVKRVDGSGGYGMLIGPKATAQEKQDFVERLRRKPEDFIAQPTLALSTCPVLVEEGLAPRHVDFRPFAIVGDGVELVPGGLTRVALKDGSLVVNSSQGGGVKDTWVLAS